MRAGEHWPATHDVVRFKANVAELGGGALPLFELNWYFFFVLVVFVFLHLDCLLSQYKQKLLAILNDPTF
mgnify:CR=1 FL=1